MATPQDIERYVVDVPRQVWVPVPPDNFVGHDLDAHLIRNIRKALTKAKMMLDVPLFGNRYHAPWITPAAFVADKLDGLFRNPNASAANGLVRHWASLCAAAGAADDPNETVATIAKRVAFAPDPRDVWPWVPRWGPAKMGPEDTVNSRPGLRVDADLRRWWNFNAPLLRPNAFDPASRARHEALREQLYMMPTSTGANTPTQRVVASVNPPPSGTP
jgi:hypothetical protein